MGFVGANMGLGFGRWRRGLAMGCVLDDREVEWERRRGTGEIENQNLVFCIIGFYELLGFRIKKSEFLIFFFK